MTDTFYKQCEFKKGDLHTIGWIPAWAAKIGNAVQLLEKGEEFWEIISVGDLAIEKSKVNEQGRAYKAFQGSTKGGGID